MYRWYTWLFAVVNQEGRPEGRLLLTEKELFKGIIHREYD
jgi:hypothetical protein